MQDAFAHCAALVRAADRDRFLATLFAPAEHRDALFALYALNIEIARVREVVRDPRAGEIRLQWWSDLLRGEALGEAAANPVAAAVLASATRYELPRERLDAIIVAHRVDLQAEPIATWAELESYAASTASELIGLSARVLGGGDGATAEQLARHAGLAYGITGLLKAFPVHIRRGQLFIPLELLNRHGAGRGEIEAGRSSPQLRAALAEMRRSALGHLAAARELIGAAPAAMLPALLPAAMVSRSLALMGRAAYDPFVPIEIPAWRRQWLIWRAARRPIRMFD